MNLYAFSLYWAAFLILLNSPRDEERDASLRSVCLGHWSWWIRKAGERTSKHWITIKKTLTDYGFIIRTLTKERYNFVVFNKHGVKIEYDASIDKLKWHI